MEGMDAYRQACRHENMEGMDACRRVCPRVSNGREGGCEFGATCRYGIRRWRSGCMDGYIPTCRRAGMEISMPPDLHAGMSTRRHTPVYTSRPRVSQRLALGGSR
jgi:hypothetical protein